MGCRLFLSKTVSCGLRHEQVGHSPHSECSSSTLKLYSPRGRVVVVPIDASIALSSLLSGRYGSRTSFERTICSMDVVGGGGAGVVAKILDAVVEVVGGADVVVTTGAVVVNTLGPDVAVDATTSPSSMVGLDDRSSVSVALGSVVGSPF